jgi:hypothetical protein
MEETTMNADPYEPWSDAWKVEQAKPVRIRLRRTKGWHLPPNTIVVARPTRWGNPFVYRHESRGLVRFGPKHPERFGRAWDYEGRISAAGTSHHMWFSADDVVETYVRWASREEIVELYRLTLIEPTPGMLAAWPSRSGRFAPVGLDDIRQELVGKNLACWCPIDQPCHADVLLELANAAEPRPNTQAAAGVHTGGTR